MEDVKYGYLGGGTMGFAYGMSASLRLYDLSGHFIYNDGNYGSLIDDGEDAIMGWALSHEQICSTTDGGTSLWVICDLTAVFRLPLVYESATYTTNYSASLLARTADLYLRDTYYQCVNLATSTDEPIIIVGGKAATAVAVDDGYIDCMINPNEIGSVDSA